MSTLVADTQLDPTRAQSRLRSYASSALTRLRLQTALNALAFGATIAAWILPVLLFADKLVSLKAMGVNVWVVWAGVSIMGIPFLLWRMFAPELHERRAAVMADERLGLNARLSSALTLDFHDPATALFGDAFLGEATRKMAAVSVKQAFPIRIPRAFGWLLVPALAAAGIYFLMPNQDVLGVAAKAASKRKAEEVKKVTAETMEGKLEDLKKQLDDKKGEENGASYKVGQLMKEAEGIAKELKDDKKNTEEAMKAMVDLKKKIEDEKENIQRGKEFSERLEKLQNKDLNLEESDHTKAVSEALKAGDASLAAKEMRVAAQKIKDLLNDPKLSDEQKKKELEKLHKEMEKLASALAEDDAMRNKLQEISNTSMSAADFQKLEAEMKKTEERQNKNSNSKFGDAIEREMEEAANELERLEEENDTKLTDEEKEEIKELDAVEASLDEALQGLSEDSDTKMGPGAPNGNPGDKSGKNGKAAAGKGKLKSMSGGARKSGKGGKESSKSASGNQGGDNKGNPNGQPQNGPGGAGQGMGRRAYQDGDATFVPEKAKGELRAGAITGISHFRGQGAKGDAPQEFYKAFDPASKDGASSLEMERWPADRREMVKDYFTRVREGAVTLPSAPSAPTATPEKSVAPVKEKLKE